MNNQPEPSTHQESHATKKTYHSPQLKNYGNINELTKTTGGGATDDGAGFPSYAS